MEAESKSPGLTIFCSLNVSKVFLTASGSLISETDNTVVDSSQYGSHARGSEKYSPAMLVLLEADMNFDLSNLKDSLSLAIDARRGILTSAASIAHRETVWPLIWPLKQTIADIATAQGRQLCVSVLALSVTSPSPNNYEVNMYQLQTWM